MKKTMLVCAFFLGFSLGSLSGSYCITEDIALLVDNFQMATDLQRGKILKDNIGAEASCGGTVSNAQEYDFFDTVNDIQGTYYQVATEPQKTKNNTPYQLIFLFRNKDEAEGLSKGDNLQKTAKIIRIEDERLQIAVWLFCGELTQKDKGLFSKNP